MTIGHRSRGRISDAGDRCFVGVNPGFSRCDREKYVGMLAIDLLPSLLCRFAMGSRFVISALGCSNGGVGLLNRSVQFDRLARLLVEAIDDNSAPRRDRIKFTAVPLRGVLESSEITPQACHQAFCWELDLFRYRAFLILESFESNRASFDVVCEPELDADRVFDSDYEFIQLGRKITAPLSRALDPALNRDPPLSSDKAVPTKTLDDGFETCRSGCVALERGTGITGRNAHSMEFNQEISEFGFFDGQLRRQ
jgi:hypothetical protein